MTSLEFTQSLAFEQLEPDPAVVTMNLMAKLVAAFYNVNRDATAHPQPYEERDFLPPPINAEAIAEDERRFTDVLAQMRANYMSQRRRN